MSSTSDGWTPRLQAKAYDNVLDAARYARAASRALALLDSPARDKALHALADALDSRGDEVLAANAADLAAATLDDAGLDRLRVTEAILAHQADRFRRLAEQPDPLGEESTDTTPDGVGLARLRVPLGVLGVVFEARPTAALEVLGPALRAGNAVLLRGALAAVHTDEALAALVCEALDGAGLPADTVALLPTRERSSIRTLVTAAGHLDLVVVRGGPRLVASALADAKVPALRLSSGNCHVYVDAAADPHRGVDVVLRSKSDPAAAHAVEGVLVHADLAPTFVPLLVDAAGRAGLRVHGDERVQQLAPGVEAVTNEGWVYGYRSADLAVAVVDGMDDALALIGRYGQGHSEVIVTRSDAAAQAFVAGVDAAVVAVNVPTGASQPAGSDGYPPPADGEGTVFSTQKLHVRGSVTAADLTTTRWVAWDASTPVG